MELVIQFVIEIATLIGVVYLILEHPKQRRAKAKKDKTANAD